MRQKHYGARVLQRESMVAGCRSPAAPTPSSWTTAATPSRRASPPTPAQGKPHHHPQCCGSGSVSLDPYLKLGLIRFRIYTICHGQPPFPNRTQTPRFLPVDVKKSQFLLCLVSLCQYCIKNFALKCQFFLSWHQWCGFGAESYGVPTVALVTKTFYDGM